MYGGYGSKYTEVRVIPPGSTDPARSPRACDRRLARRYCSTTAFPYTVAIGAPRWKTFLTIRGVFAGRQGHPLPRSVSQFRTRRPLENAGPLTMGIYRIVPMWSERRQNHDRR